MHVVLVSPCYPPDNGWDGIGTYTAQAAQALGESGHRVTVLAAPGAQGAYSNTAGLVTTIRADGVGYGSPAGVLKVLAQLMQRNRPDVIEFPAFSGLGVSFQRAYPKFPIVVRLHSAFDVLQPRWKPLMRSLLRRPANWYAATRASAERAHLVTACSAWVLKIHQDRWRLPRGEVIYNPVADICANMPARARKKNTVLFFGRVGPVKGADLLLPIAQRVWRESPETRFEVVGQDEIPGATEAIRQQVSPEFADRIQFLGGVPYSEIPGILSSYVIGFFVSAHEAFSYTLAESMLARIACVNASGGGAGELGTHQRHFLRSQRCPDAIAASLLLLLRDPHLCAQLGTQARAHVLTEFSPKRIAGEMVSAYAAAINLGVTQ